MKSDRPDLKRVRAHAPSGRLLQCPGSEEPRVEVVWLQWIFRGVDGKDH